jgi:uncharacterized protein DUF1761
MAVDFAVNYVAVVIAAVVAMVIGFAYYAPQVMGDRWMSYLGTTRAQLGNPAPTGMLAGVVASLLNAWVLAVLAKNLGGTSFADGAMLGVICWLGFMATITAAEVAFLKQPWALWLVNNVHNVIVQIVMGAIVVGLH